MASEVKDRINIREMSGKKELTLAVTGGKWKLIVLFYTEKLFQLPKRINVDCGNEAVI
ncbi:MULTISPECIES: hypothetical protein [Paenibacillus]|uniref:Uncharacterized protein n=1 Tax=Paenibacillus naphthalenovorans TaxID=162209 RepID=A0A0U2W3F4_9BACL|nr:MULTISPECIES: hypothetical protein [Paenibacillus]ALS23092.1 hypothetical protein IJ22_27190 [Paenibacillus naphthalenovorans]GCL71847.1 hypothetical protein PN4B1_17520 [Paenibacillus naphthalenovorans]